VDVDDLAELVDRPVHVPPCATDLDVGLIHEPAVADGVSTGSGGFDEQRREALGPSGDVIDVDTSLGEHFLGRTARSAGTSAPPPRHLWWEPVAGEE